MKLIGHRCVGAISVDLNQSYVVTTAERLKLDPAELAAVDESGLVRPLQDGRGELRIEQEGARLTVRLEVAGVAEPVPVSPVNVMASTPGCRVTAAPVEPGPRPCTTL